MPRNLRFLPKMSHIPFVRPPYDLSTLKNQGGFTQNSDRGTGDIYCPPCDLDIAWIVDASLTIRSSCTAVDSARSASVR